ncbi:hypothetical protein D9M73_130340 [compost metagenome]
MAGHAQHQFAVVEQQPRARFDRRKDFLVRQFDAGRVARRGVAVEREGLAFFQRDSTAFKLADAQFWPLQIGEDGRRAAVFFFQGADRLDHRDLRLLVAMAHIDAKRIGARFEQRGDHFGGAACGTERREDADLARTRGYCLCHEIILALGMACARDALTPISARSTVER